MLHNKSKGKKGGRSTFAAAAGAAIAGAAIGAAAMALSDKKNRDKMLKQVDKTKKSLTDSVHNMRNKTADQIDTAQKSMNKVNEKMNEKADQAKTKTAAEK